mmetsp:Transcript_108050/g.247799  ORF Transcript_108050/g.247799 Transcript_108050/m.247799 type:complete len:251 (-) Transcript_108050:133-885(-)
MPLGVQGHADALVECCGQLRLSHQLGILRQQPRVDPPGPQDVAQQFAGGVVGVDGDEGGGDVGALYGKGLARSVGMGVDAASHPSVTSHGLPRITHPLPPQPGRALTRRVHRTGFIIFAKKMHNPPGSHHSHQLLHHLVRLRQGVQHTPAGHQVDTAVRVGCEAVGIPLFEGQPVGEVFWALLGSLLHVPCLQIDAPHIELRTQKPRQLASKSTLTAPHVQRQAPTPGGQLDELRDVGFQNRGLLGPGGL